MEFLEISSSIVASPFTEASRHAVAVAAVEVMEIGTGAAFRVNGVMHGTAPGVSNLPRTPWFTRPKKPGRCIAFVLANKTEWFSRWWNQIGSTKTKTCQDMSCDNMFQYVLIVFLIPFDSHQNQW